jgi:membrane protease YdiL (CAAX protease family)
MSDPEFPLPEAVQDDGQDGVAGSPVPTRPERNPFWNYVDLLLFIGIGLSIFVLLCLPFAVAMHFAMNSPHVVVMLLVGIQAVLYVAVYFGFKVVLGVRYRKPVFSSLGWCRSHANLLLAGLGGFILAFVVSGIAALLHTPTVKSPIEEFTDSVPALTCIAILAVTVGPLFEELLFRGFLQPLFSRSVGTVMGIALTALLFGTLHLKEYANVWKFALAIWIVGVALGTVRARTGSIIPSTVMHACFNLVSVVVLILTKFGKLNG